MKGPLSPDEAVSLIRKGDTVFIGSCCGAPPALEGALAQRLAEVSGVTLLVVHGGSPAPYVATAVRERVRVRCILPSRRLGPALESGAAEYLPLTIFHAAREIRSGRLRVDVALVQVAPPDEEGRCSLGLSADVTYAAARTARTVIAEVSERVPRTSVRLAASAIHAWVAGKAPPFELVSSPISEADRQIAAFVASVVPDRAVVQVGIGSIPDAVTAELQSRRGLAIHTGLFTDGLMRLLESGAVDNLSKPFDRGLTVATTVMGSAALYRFVDRSPDFRLRPGSYTHHPAVLARLPRMVAINGALEVDLFGQVNAESLDGVRISGAGGLPDFARGALAAPGGRSIIALRSTSRDGLRSRILPRLGSGNPVTLSVLDADYIVTEYGVARLRGRAFSQRREALIAIAHPSNRRDLRQRADEESC